MAAGRSTKNLIGRRRKMGEDEEEDGQGSVQDLQSDTSIQSDGEKSSNAAAGGDVGLALPDSNDNKTPGKKKSKKQNGKSKDGAVQPIGFTATADTQAMMQGLTIDDSAEATIDYEQKTERTDAVAKQGQSKEQAEQKVARTSDPAFIPSRGNFFMHDTRSRNQPNGQALAGRGRGRGQANGVGHDARPAEQVWKHDLHEAINEETQPASDLGGNSSARLFTRPSNAEPAASHSPLTFSSTTLVGRVQIRVMLPRMSKPISYAEVPLKKYVRLPDHRPPLRRDKPLRIFLPDIGPRYIFPATERSFIFIPRQMRPNHRAFGSTAQRSIAGYGYSSRRTSMYAGSVYSASIAASRRSSIARDREGMFSPGSYASGFQPPNKPVVRLPRGAYHDSMTPPMVPFSGQHTPVHQTYTYPLPQQPAFQGTPTTTVQHPRPQKAISVSGIESPAALTQRQTPTEQPFHSQLPTHMMPDHTAPYFSPRQQYAYPAGITSPLSHVPEHPQGYPQQMYGYPQQPYYYPPMPMHMVPPQQQQQPYMYQPAPADVQAYAQPTGDAQASGMLAHESNGMVFYMPASEVSQATPTEQYQPAEGFVPNYAVPGMPPTPGPDRDAGYYYGNAYYQPMQQS